MSAKPAPVEGKRVPPAKDAEHALRDYHRKRDFQKTGEPRGDDPGKSRRKTATVQFVVQKHWARRLHYDFRLELEGTLKSWAVPKGPSLDPSVKRMAIQVEDHPLAYGDFEGTIPKGQYGAGKVIVWDRGTWEAEGDAAEAYAEGKLKFRLKGSKLQGRWALIRTGGRRKDPNTSNADSEQTEKGRSKEDSGDGTRKTTWLLIKEKDDFVRPAEEYDITTALPHSVGMPGKPDNAKGAVSQKSELPEYLEPQLATRVSAAPTAPGWSFELKYDGYRILTRVSRGKAKFFTRNRHDWTHRLPGLVDAFESQALPDGWYDGEIVMLDERGRPDFQALQNAFERQGGLKRHSTARANSDRKPPTDQNGPVYFIFDLPWLQNQDLRRLPLRERQARLATVMDGVDDARLRLSGVFSVGADDMLRSACALGLEGVIGKRQDAPYTSGRTGHWIKLKCAERQEFVIGGFTEPQGGRSSLGALLLGHYDEDGYLKYAGKVGTGFNENTLKDLFKRLSRIEQKTSPFEPAPREKQVHWVKPQLAAEVSFSQWTQSGRIRHAVFVGLREDKRTRLMKKEQSVKISSAERVVDRKSGARKADIATYYERIAPLLIPHLKDRPVSLLRAPEGINGELFFQKHMDAQRLSGIMELDPELDPGHDPLVVIRNALGLTQAAQLNTIEFHTWNAVRSRIDRPDRITFDLDPGKGVEWQSMQEAAVLLRNFLQELELPAFLKTSGGKGLHVVVPIIRRYDWDAVKGFSKAVVQHMAEVLPRRFSAKSGPRNRVGKIFIDYLRNGFGATTVSAWSLRARPGMGISVPITWEEVETIESGAHWTILNIEDRMEIGNQPWDAYEKSSASLGRAMKAIGFES